MSGKQVRVFLADGTPGGLLTAEIMNWTGHVVAAPRSDLAALVKRPEVGKTGIYLLLGDDPEAPGQQLVYIGEADDVGKRLYQHGRDETKDFWDRALVLTSKDMNLTKAHARYLESRFISLASEAGRARLTNSTAPLPSGLPEADISDMEYFIAQAKIILPVLGINLLRTTSIQRPSPASVGQELNQSPILMLSQARASVDAIAQEIDGEFTVRAGSHARQAWMGTDTNYRKLRDRLESDGTLAPADAGTGMVLQRDTVFASPSAAAAVLLGRNANGRLEWKVQGTGQTYGAWQDQLLDAAKPQDD